MSLPAYAEYKDSGVEWLGDVPEHWTTCQLRRVILKIEQGWSPECENRVAEDDEWGVLKTGCLNGGRFNVLESKALPSYLSPKTEYQIHKNDLLMSRASGSPKLIGSVALVPKINKNLMMSDKIFRLNFDEKMIEKEFFVYVSVALFFRAQLENAISGAEGLANNLPQTNIKGFWIAIPRITEQEKIIKFLDHETAKIDALIAEQQRLIELLKEKRQAVISHAVTKGLDPNAPMKDSGVEWLGDVPEHWVVAKLSKCCGVLAGYSFASENFNSNQEDVKLLRGINLGVGEIRWSDCVYWNKQENDGLDRFLLSEGDVILGMDRPWISGGIRVARVRNCDTPSLLVQRVAKFLPSKKISHDFLYLLVGSGMFKFYLEPEFTGVSVPHISADQILGFSIAIPPLSEQLKIANHVAKDFSKIDELISHAHQGIDLLKERRSALISAAVTGKIDVRGWQPPATAATTPQGQQQILFDD